MRHYDVSQALFFPARRLRGIRAPFLRALLRPMAIACLRDLTRCLPERMWCISVRTERLPFAELFDRRGIGNLVSVENRHGSLGWQFEETERSVGSGSAFLHGRACASNPSLRGQLLRLLGPKEAIILSRGGIMKSFR